ncbi:Nif3-like dinuclear metal center hexameric protein [Olivibacter sp. SDN3]|uniref:Nif3-like dinuclear metal center hexameric protein n=1 Tax=Olivibacter sp. SDN3 TaxID=2764720 RepID=UPI00165192A3|nr:Nif3-like dinuclear metal center hexameric protein [Olivibacter sp. SDN3]QNL51187.1 Nif3-like dinuclear metal center hexameric protein [Olivibacter sp. SDN3]
MILSELVNYLEKQAPLAYQEGYDNSGLIVGTYNKEIKSGLISLDCTEDVVHEAVESGCDIIISHHPIVFKGLKKLNGNSYVERVVMKAIKHDIAIYAIHTNLDNVNHGVNRKIADKLKLSNCSILLPKDDLLYKLVVFVPKSDAETLRDALFQAGAGAIGNYSECSFNTEGLGTFKAGDGTNPYVGNVGERHHEKEEKVEVIYPKHVEKKLVVAMHEAHPYEEVAYDIYKLQNKYHQVGSGMIGQTQEALEELDFLAIVKENLNVQVIRHSNLNGKKIQRVAVCGGAGGFLLPHAIRMGADAFVTADYKYHEFFDAEGKILITDVGHFESEQFTQELLLEIIQKKFPNFAVRLTGVNTNPINYYI